MGLTYLQSDTVKPKLVFWRKVVVSIVLLASYGWFIAAGAPRPAAEVRHGPSTQLRPIALRTIRLDAALRECNGQDVINGILGLLRNEGARVVGLSDLLETDHKANGNRACEAVVNLAFGTQRISYTLERVGQRRKTWELSVTLL